MSLSKPLTQTFEHEKSITVFDSTTRQIPHISDLFEFSKTEVLEQLPKVEGKVWVYNDSNISYTHLDVTDLTVSTLGYEQVLYLDHEGKGTYQIVKPTDTKVFKTDDFIYWTQVQDLKESGVTIFYFHSEVRK